VDAVAVTTAAKQSLLVAIVSTSCSALSASDVTATSGSITVISQSPAGAMTSTPGGRPMASYQSSPVTLEKLRPMPRAGPRKSSGGRKQQKSLTDMPVRAELRAIPYLSI